MKSVLKVCAAGGALVMGGAASGQVEFFGVIKTASYEQAAVDVQPTTAVFWSFEAFVEMADVGDAATGLVDGIFPMWADTLPGGGLELSYYLDTMTKAEMDAAFPSGTSYELSIDGGVLGARSQTLALTADSYPSSVPFFTGLSEVAFTTTDVSQDITLTWNSAVGSGATAIVVTVIDDVTDEDVLFVILLDTTLTSLTIPGGTLEAGTPYVIEIEFATVEFIEGLPVPGFGEGATPVPDLGVVGFTIITSAFLTTASGCAADINGDGSLNAFDVFQFLGDYDLGACTGPSGDFNGDGACNAFDVFEFLGAYDNGNGCP